jgi:hypothetical protein
LQPFRGVDKSSLDGKRGESKVLKQSPVPRRQSSGAGGKTLVTPGLLTGDCGLTKRTNTPEPELGGVSARRMPAVQRAGPTRRARREPSDANEALPHRHRRSPRHRPRNVRAWAVGRRSESQSPAVQAGPRRKSFGSRSSPYQGEPRYSLKHRPCPRGVRTYVEAGA